METSTLTETDKALLAMLRENTGTHFLDSGGESGRHWQHNEARDIEHEETSLLSFKYGEISVAHRVFHWLRERLEFDEEAADAFDGPFREEVDSDDDKSWGELREDFPGWFARWKSLEDTRGCASGGYTAAVTAVTSSGGALVGSDGRDGCDDCTGSGTCGDESLYSATGIYGESEPVTVNSYNEENLLDQVILFTYFELRTGLGRGGNHGSYVVLQIHGGCDVRGGYTRPRVFRVTDDDELAIFDFRRGTIFCEAESEHWWSTDDGYHWYAEGACGRGAGKQLEQYERVTLKAAEDSDHDLMDSEEWGNGVVCVTDGGEGLCPLCGGSLHASAR